VKKQLRKKVSAAGRNGLAVGDHIELAELSRRANRIDPEALSNEGRETRDLGLGAFSCGAVNDFDLRIGHDPPHSTRPIMRFESPCLLDRKIPRLKIA
jgi:hypothetical protein